MNEIISNLSVDCVIFGFDYNRLNVLLVERVLNDPATGQVLIDDWTLTGFHIQKEENLDEAASRILKKLSGLDNIFLEQFYAFGDVDRVLSAKDQLWLQRQYSSFSNRVITVGYYSLIDSSTVTLSLGERNLQWFPVDQLPELGYDHRQIIDKALETLRNKLRHEPVAFELLPEKFSMGQLQKLYEAIMGTTFDRRNFRKKVLQMKYLMQLDEKQADVKHRAGWLYRFDKELYEKTRRERFDFSI